MDKRKTHIKVPYNLFEYFDKQRRKLKRLIRSANTGEAMGLKPGMFLMPEEEEWKWEIINTCNQDLKELKKFKRAVEFYYQIIAMHRNNEFDKKTYISEIVNELGCAKNTAYTYTKLLLDQGLAEWQKDGQKFTLIGYNQLWDKLGIKNYKRKNRKDKCEKVGLWYERDAYKRQKLKKPYWIKKLGKRVSYKKVEYKIKTRIPLLKIQVGSGDLADRKNLHKLVCDAAIKHRLTFNKLDQKKKHKNAASDPFLYLSSYWFGRMSGTSTSQGYRLRKAMEDEGVIKIHENKEVVAENLKYEQAKEAFVLQNKLPSERHGMLYHKKSKTVFKVSCYQVEHRHYVPKFSSDISEFHLDKIKDFG